jgi:hypothetical protein
MGRIAQKFYDSTTSVEVIVGCDAICAFCPYNKGGECHREEDSSQKVKCQDLKVMAKLGLKPKTVLSTDETRIRIRKELTAQDLFCICQGCEWLSLGYCVEGLEQLENGGKTISRELS